MAIKGKGKHKNKNRLKELSTAQSNMKIKDLMKERKTLRARDMKPGNLLFTSYDAKDKEQTYDRTPLVLILRSGRSHTLGLNFHWIPMSMRINLIKKIISMNSKNIKKNLPLDFDYHDLKPMLKSLGYAPCIRLYINPRLGKKAVILPPERLIEAARLKSESFTNGRYSATQLYQMARASGKKRRK